MKSTLAFFDVDRSYRNSRCFFQFSPGQAHTRGERAVTWEYKAMTLKDANVDSVHEDWEEKLNRVGAEGWKLVGTIPFLRNGNTAGRRILLKRRQF